MLYLDRIDVSEGIDVNKTNASKKCDIYHHWYFLDKGFKFQLDVCNGCHDVLMISINLIDIAILNIGSANYQCIINRMRKSKTVNLTEKTDLTEKTWTL